MTDQQITDLLKLIGAVVALSVAYGQILGPYQFRLVEWTVAALGTEGRYKGVVNLGVGVVLAACFGVLLAIQTGEWIVLATVILAAVLASVKAAEVHDQQDHPPTTEQKSAPRAPIVAPQNWQK